MKSRSAAPRRFSASDTLISVFPRKTELESEGGQASSPLSSAPREVCQASAGRHCGPKKMDRGSWGPAGRG